MSKKVYLKDSQAHLMLGVNLLADAVKSTLGPSGKSVIIQNFGEEPFATKDGVTVAKSMNDSDPVVNVGMQLVKKVATKMDEDGGDGTTTATVLCRSIIELGMNLRSKQKFDEHEFRNTIYSEQDYVIKELEKKSIKINLKDIYKVALTSANNDLEIAKLFQKAFNNSKKDGYINIVESTTGKSYVDIIKGYVIELGYMDRKYANNSLTNFFEAKKARVVLYDNEFSDRKEMLKLIDRTNKKNPLPLIIFAKDYSKDVVNLVDFNNSDRIGDKICLIKNPLRNDEYLNLVSDIEHYTGATPIKEFDEFDAEFGEANNVIIKQGYTILGENVGTKDQLLNDYLNTLEFAAKDEASHYHSGQMKKRVDRMRNGVTTFYVGGNSDIEIKEKKHRVEDAYKACNAALQGSVIVGGGQSLVLLSKDLNITNPYEDVFYRSIQKPFIEILRNSLHDDESISYIKNNISFEVGYNAKTRTFENLYNAGIIDPLSIIVNGLKNAVSIAMTILSTECLIVETQKTKENEF